MSGISEKELRRGHLWSQTLRILLELRDFFFSFFFSFGGWGGGGGKVLRDFLVGERESEVKKKCLGPRAEGNVFEGAEEEFGGRVWELCVWGW